MKESKYIMFRGGGDDVVSPLPKNTLLYYLMKENYANIIYLCFDKGYIYKKELESYFLINAKHHISYLVGAGIIEEFELDKKRQEDLTLIKNLNEKNIKFLVTYRLTDQARSLLQNPMMYDILCENISSKAKKYKQYLIDVYNEKKEEIDRKKKEEEDKLWLRYQIAKGKCRNSITAEDLALISMFEK